MFTLGESAQLEMNVLELFSGTGSLARVAKERGHNVVTLDLCPKHSPTICANILEWDHTVYPPDYFDYIHASCPCEQYSRARTTGGPRNLELADALVKRTLEILDYFSSALWTVENPETSLLWQRPVAQPLLEQVAKTSYCRYEYPYRKNTSFANNFGLKLRPVCDGTCGQMSGRQHLQHAQRGGGGFEKIRQSLDQLHSIPPILCDDIVQQVYFFIRERST